MKKALVILAALVGGVYVVALGVGLFQLSSGGLSGCGLGCQAARPNLGPRGMPWPASPEISQQLVDQALAQALGLKPDQLQAARRQGVSLSDLAAKQGESLSELRQAFVSDLQPMLDQAVAKGELSRDQADALLSHLQDGLGFEFGRWMPFGRGGIPGEAPGRRPQRIPGLK
jgi:hypothetical protein